MPSSRRRAKPTPADVDRGPARTIHTSFQLACDLGASLSGTWSLIDAETGKYLI
jgi:hypothetical protein